MRIDSIKGIIIIFVGIIIAGIIVVGAVNRGDESISPASVKEAAESLTKNIEEITQEEVKQEEEQEETESISEPTPEPIVEEEPEPKSTPEPISQPEPEPEPEPKVIRGCTDWKALNYNPDANTNDGSCEYKIWGCTDSSALNYNYNATDDDGSCNYPKPETLTYLKLNKSYISKTGITITLTSIEKTEDTGSYKYIISYKQENKTANKELDEGTFKMFFGDGTGLNQYGSFDKIFPSENITRTYTFQTLKTQKPFCIEFNDDIDAGLEGSFFRNQPATNTLKWRIER